MTAAPWTAAPRGRIERVRSLQDRMARIASRVKLGLLDGETRRLSLAVASGDDWTPMAMASHYGYRPLDLSGLRRNVPARDEGGELSNIFAFVRHNVRYTGDISSADTYCSAWTTIMAFRAGDCDDHLVAVTTLAAHSGYGCLGRSAATGSRDVAGNQLIDHVYGVVLVPKFAPAAGLVMDTTLPGAMGAEASHSARVDFRLT